MFQNKNLSAVKNNTLFKGVSDTDLKFNFKLKNFIEIGEGEIIYQSGDPSDFLYLIIEGEVKLKIPGGAANPLLLKKVNNDFFGEKEVHEKSVRNSSAVANKDTLVYVIRKIDLSSMAQRSKELRYNLLGNLQEDNEMGSNKKEAEFNGLTDKLPEQSFFQPDNNKSAEITNYSEPAVIGNTGEEINDEAGLNYETELPEVSELRNDTEANHENDPKIKDTWNIEGSDYNGENPSMKMKTEYRESNSEQANSSFENSANVQDLLHSDRLIYLNKIANFLINDIKNPLITIKQYSEHIKKQDVSKEINLVLDMIIEQANFVVNLVQTTLGYSEGKSISNPQPILLSNALDYILSMLAEYVESRNVKLFKKFDGDGLVNLDKKGVYQACFQIAKNACDAMPQGGNFYIVTKREGDKIRIELKDNGSGIPESIKDRIFEPFITHGKNQKSGLGLAITEKIIKEHNGMIWAESYVGEGTVFTIVLPVLD
jgi:signal transduction histidine kinase